VAHEEALLVVVGVDEPAGDLVGGVGADLAGGGVVDVEAAEFDLQLAAFEGAQLEVGLAEGS